MLLTQKVGIVTGGPGTGKTTIVQEFLDRTSKSVALCAPTGKAAKRIAEVTQHSATTVHRLLGAKQQNGQWIFDHNENNLLSHEIIIVDEASMLDAELAFWLLRAVHPGRTSVFFIGDVNQLPSVGPGQVFADLIDSGRVLVARLEHVHRAAQESWVCRNAPAILIGDLDILTPCPDFKFYEEHDVDVVADKVVSLVTSKMPAAGVKDIHVMTPQNAGPIGVETLNVRLQAKLNPVDGRGEEVWSVRANKGTTYQLRPDDLVMATENDYKRFVFNGEIGRIQSIDPAKKEMTVDFDDRLVQYDKESARTLRLAYAMTVHKNQGSEAEWVVVVCHDAHHYMWSQSLLYTAVTRAKKGVVIVGNREGILAALENDDAKRRLTTLEDRLRG